MRKMLYKRKGLEENSTFRYSIYRAGSFGYEDVYWSSQLPTIVDTLFRLVKYHPIDDTGYKKFFAEILGLLENEEN